MIKTELVTISIRARPPGAEVNPVSVRDDQIIAFAKRYAVPTIYEFRYYVAAGGLVSYGPDILDSYRLTGNLVGRILKGEKPGDLPVMRPSKFELVVNMKTAKALGIEVPNSMQLLADEIIE